MSFEQSLSFGQAGESSIAKWLKSRGNTVLPTYEKIIDNGKGPRIFLPDSILVSPDFLCWNGQKVQWIEAKHKHAFTWHRLTQRWVTGIDLRHYRDYLKVAEQSPWPVWLLFLHDGGQAKDSPANSPKGLFGNDIAYLRKPGNINHTHENWGRGGMVYWAVESLKKLDCPEVNYL